MDIAQISILAWTILNLIVVAILLRHEVRGHEQQ
jgi:hypothetical protein